MKIRFVVSGLALLSLASLAACEDAANDTVSSPEIDSGLPDSALPDASTNIDGSAPTNDAAVDAGADADAAAPTPTCKVGDAFTDNQDLALSTRSATLTPDELEMIFVDANGGLEHGVRATKADAFTFTVLVVNTPANKVSVAMSADGLTLWIIAASASPVVVNHNQLYSTTRAARNVEFGATPVAGALAQNNTGSIPTLNLSHDGSSFFFTDAIGGGFRVRQTALSGTLGDSQAAGNEVFVNPQPTFSKGGVVTNDGLHMYTALTSIIVNGGGPQSGTGTLSLSSRAAVADKFSTPAALLVPAHVAGTDDYPVWISPDACSLYYVHGTNLQIAKRNIL